jgi:hypothetical protein
MQLLYPGFAFVLALRHSSTPKRNGAGLFDGGKFQPAFGFNGTPENPPC